MIDSDGLRATNEHALVACTTLWTSANPIADAYTCSEYGFEAALIFLICRPLSYLPRYFSRWPETSSLGFALRSLQGHERDNDG